MSYPDAVYMPPPANNTFYQDVTVTFDENGVSTVEDTRGNKSVNQSPPYEVVLNVKNFQETETWNTITIRVEH
jgi:hypothetical protein